MFWYPSKPHQMPATSPALDRLDRDPSWVAEPKMNGWRIEAFLHQDTVHLVTRQNRLLDDPSLDEVCRTLQPRLHPGLVIDGELLFQGPHAPRPLYFPFDVPVVNGLPDPRTLIDRRLTLEALLGSRRRGPVKVLRQVRDHKIRFLNTVIQDPDVEGIVLKHVQSSVHLSVRESAINPSWFKVKEPRP